jgi:putative ABC transport system permease protein
MLQSFKLAIKSIWGNKMRSFLTMLGIIIGVAAVIILVSLVNGYMGSVVESFASTGVNQINVNMTNLTSRTVDADQMYAFYDEHGDLFDGISPNVSLSATVKKGDDSMDSTSVAGRSEQYLDMKDYDL